MSAPRNDHPEIMPMAIAALIAAMSLAALVLLDFGPGNSAGNADGMITASVVSRAGATATPSEKPTKIAAPQTVVVSERPARRWFSFD